MTMARQAKEHDFGTADVTLGYFYQVGVGTKPDDRQALEHFSFAAEAGVGQALSPLARCLEKGRGVEVDLSRAAELYASATEYDVDNFEDLVEFVKQHPEFTSILDSVVDKIEERAFAGDKAAIKVVGKYFYDCDDGARAVQHLMSTASDGDPEAMYMLSDFYSGLNKPSYRKESVELLQQSADKGHVPAQRVLAWSKHKSNPGIAFEYMKKAADSGSVAAIYGLGLFYQTGVGTEANYEVSFDLCQRAADGGHLPAYSALANRFAHGIGTTANLRSALYWFGRAIQEEKEEEELMDIQSDLLDLIGQVDSAGLAELMAKLTFRLSMVQSGVAD